MGRMVLEMPKPKNNMFHTAPNQLHLPAEGGTSQISFISLRYQSLFPELGSFIKAGKKLLGSG